MFVKVLKKNFFRFGERKMKCQKITFFGVLIMVATE